MTDVKRHTVDEIRAARAVVAANKTGWVQVKPEWFPSREMMAAYLCERNKKKQLAMLG